MDRQRRGREGRRGREEGGREGEWEGGREMKDRGQRRGREGGKEGGTEDRGGEGREKDRGGDVVHSVMVSFMSIVYNISITIYILYVKMKNILRESYLPNVLDFPGFKLYPGLPDSCSKITDFNTVYRV